MNLKKPIKVRLLKEASDYFFSQNEKVRRKLFLAFDKTESGYKGDWFKKLKNTDIVITKNSLVYLHFGNRQIKKRL